MLKLVVKTELPKDCVNVCGDAITLQRIQPDLGGKVRVLATLKFKKRYRPVI